jgi:hypothetical protein
MNVELIGRGYAWLDMGTYENLIEASAFIRTFEQRQGLNISCPEEIALRRGLISPDIFLQAAKKFDKSEYGRYLLSKRLTTISAYLIHVGAHCGACIFKPIRMWKLSSSAAHEARLSTSSWTYVSILRPMGNGMPNGSPRKTASCSIYPKGLPMDFRRSKITPK